MSIVCACIYTTMYTYIMYNIIIIIHTLTHTLPLPPHTHTNIIYCYFGLACIMICAGHSVKDTHTQARVICIQMAGCSSTPRGCVSARAPELEFSDRVLGMNPSHAAARRFCCRCANITRPRPIIAAPRGGGGAGGDLNAYGRGRFSDFHGTSHRIIYNMTCSTLQRRSEETSFRHSQCFMYTSYYIMIKRLYKVHVCVYIYSTIHVHRVSTKREQIK